jgi:hypothetical protein
MKIPQTNFPCEMFIISAVFMVHNDLYLGANPVFH